MKFFFRKIMKYVFIPFGIIYKIFKTQPNKVVILMYHRVNDKVKKELSVKYDNFKWHMNYLKKKNYSVVSMDEAVCMIKSKSITGKNVVLTFDDGYEDFYINAFPILKEYNFPAIVYFVPGFIETGRVYWWDKDIGKSELMNWSQINELKKSGIIDFGSHSLNHLDIDKLDNEKLRLELEISKKYLWDKTGKEIKHFSYPRGVYSETVERVIAESYSTGVLIYEGKEITSSFDKCNITRLKRLPIQRSDGKYLFIARIRGWLVIEELIRLVYRIIGANIVK